MTCDARAIVDLLREEIVRIGWTETARRSGFDRAALHRAFRKGKAGLPAFTTIACVALAVGVKIQAHKA